MKIVIINGSPRKSGNGSKFLKKLMDELISKSDIEVDLINLAEKEIKMCKGCQVCYEKGEKFCPLKDDVLDIRERLWNSDGIVFYSPTYVVNISGIMKNFIDRLSYICHRPAFFGKYALLLTTTGSSGGASALKCLKWPALAWGYRIVGSIGIKMAIHNYDKVYNEKISAKLESAADLLVRQIHEKKASNPNLAELIGFSMKKRNYQTSKNVYKYDVEYWKEKGWLDKDMDYFFAVSISMLKKYSVKSLSNIVKLIM